MKQETITDYHNMNRKPMKKYHALQIRDTVTGRKKWAVVWFTGNSVMYKRFPVTYGMRAAVRLAKRMEKEWGQYKDVSC